jgi:hypothetical protein
VTAEVLATIAWEDGVAFLTSDRPRLVFGRSSQCDVRVAHQPLADASVPRVAGAILAFDGRVAVDNLSDKVAFDVKPRDGVLETVRPRTLVAPPDARFEILLGGATGTHVVAVHRTNAGTDLPRPVAVTTEEPPTTADPVLTDRQWRILEAYTAPLRAGSTTPATHAEVAAEVHWGYSLVRVECHAIWAALRLAGVPLRAFPDTRDAVVDAAVRHQLRRPRPDIP